MATTEHDAGADPRSPLGRFVHGLLAGRPMIALLVSLLTTGGHTMNLREMGVAQGWVPAEAFALQSCYLISLALTVLVGPVLARGWTCRRLTEAGLLMAAVGAVLNVLNLGQPMATYLFGRAVAGAGAGLVVYAAPRMLDRSWHVAIAWAAILCPVAGPGVVALATMMNETSDWRNGFLFEGASAVVGLVAILSMGEAVEQAPKRTSGSANYLPGLIVGFIALMYVLHWGQLHGWMEADDVVAAVIIAAVALLGALWLAWPQLDWGLIHENWARLVLFSFGGFCQFFYAYLMNVYGGSMINLSSWQRVLLIWPLPIGISTALVASRIRYHHVRLLFGLPGAILGLLLLAYGLYMCYYSMLEWPYWDVRDVVDLNWFPAPGERELMPGRYVMGLGIGLFMVVMDLKSSRDPDREETMRPLLSAVQFLGGGVAAGVMINFLIIGHKVHYSYSAERDAIQAEELARREDMVRDVLRQAGQPAPARSTEVMLYRFIHYEADNLVFVTIYAWFSFSAIALAVFFSGLWLWRHWRHAGAP